MSDGVFASRARRLLDLAPGHAIEGYLRFASELAAAQAIELERYPNAPTPANGQLHHCRGHGLPPLSVNNPFTPGWRQGLRRILDYMRVQATTTAAAHVARELSDADGATLDQGAAQLLAGDYNELEPARAPFIGAALQVHWVKMALNLGADGRSAGVDFGLCPVCGSPPVVGLIRSGGAERGLRYLVCSLCASEWHVVRIKCSHCASTKDVKYLFIDGANDAIKAECCGDCKTYLKILYLDQDNQMESLADDLATLALDMLVDEQGFQRVGPNLLLSPGSPS